MSPWNAHFKTLLNNEAESLLHLRRGASTETWHPEKGETSLSVGSTEEDEFGHLSFSGMWTTL